MIEDAYKFVCDNSADTYKNLLTYFRDQWLSGPFDRKSWSVHKEEIRTNNSIEGRPNTERNSSYTGQLWLIMKLYNWHLFLEIIFIRRMIKALLV